MSEHATIGHIVTRISVKCGASAVDVVFRSIGGAWMVFYEAGQHATPRRSERANRAWDFLIQHANRHPKMYGLYDEFYKLMRKASPDGVIVYYNGVQKFGKFGSWGLREYRYNQSPDEMPKYRFVKGIMPRVREN